MFSLAYRMLGSAQDAEDAVQDAYPRWSGADRTAIERPAAWLTKVVTNLCLNRLTSARARREAYVGSWLPEPVITSDGALGPLESAEQRDTVSMALLILLERLTPVERAVFVLREAFAYSHREIAGVLDIGEANSRQLYRRASRAVVGERARFDTVTERREEFVTSFFAAAREGDLAGLEKILTADVTWWGDGGGKATATRRPIAGRAKVLRLLVGGMDRFAYPVDLSYAEVNGAPAMVARATGAAGKAGAVVGIASFAFRDGLISEVRAVVNPDKLTFVARQLSPA
ncbi:RNA polymerase sigma-70 factor [Streptomyces sp. NPDC048441]|uniref:RNA polymerase sigma-70 factor n=1 Tax=Streptomyces sp. NPDC048441 TaxID=3365552 RepID=UPI00371ED306